MSENYIVGVPSGEIIREVDMNYLYDVFLCKFNRKNNEFEYLDENRESIFKYGKPKKPIMRNFIGHENFYYFLKNHKLLEKYLKNLVNVLGNKMLISFSPYR